MLALTPTWKGYLLAVLSAVCYGLIPLFILPLNQQEFPLDTTLFLRFTIAALLLSGYLIYQKESFKTTARELGILAILGVLFALSSEFLFLGYTLLSPGIASTIMFIYPIIVALIMAIVYRERLTAATQFSLIITFIGVMLLSWQGEDLRFNASGLLVTMLCALMYALYIVIINKARISGSGTKISFYSMLFSAGYYLFKILFTAQELGTITPKTLVHISVFALITTLLSIVALVYAIRLIGSTNASISGAVEPVVAVLISVALFGESLTVNLIVGIALILLGVIWVLVGNRKSGA